MQYTPEQERAFKDTFAVRQRRQLFPLLLPFAVILALFFGADYERMVHLILGLFFVSVLVSSWKNWRCPACNRYLGNISFPRYCHSCGVALL